MKFSSHDRNASCALNFISSNSFYWYISYSRNASCALNFISSNSFYWYISYSRNASCALNLISSNSFSYKNVLSSREALTLQQFTDSPNNDRRSLGRLFQKRVVCTKFDIFEFVLLVYQLFQKRVVYTNKTNSKISNLVHTTRFWNN
jgi:hypothetical protein